MIDWTARIDYLAEKLSREHAMADRQALTILLSSLVDCPRTPSVWLILETNWHSRDALDGWFSFGATWPPQTLPRLRARHPWRQIEDEIQQYLDSPSDPRLFIEPDFDRYPQFHRLTQSQFLLQRSLRVRTLTTRSADPLRSLDERAEERRQDELASGAAAVLEDHVGVRGQDPPAFHQPADFLYQLETLQRLAPWYPDWNIFVRAFASLAIRHAWLHGRPETGPEENMAMARVAADTIPPWIARALRILVKGPAKSNVLEIAMRLEDKGSRSGHGGHAELVRLRRKGIIHWVGGNTMHWTLDDKHREAVIALLDGYAFDAPLKACA